MDQVNGRGARNDGANSPENRALKAGSLWIEDRDRIGWRATDAMVRKTRCRLWSEASVSAREQGAVSRVCHSPQARPVRSRRTSRHANMFRLTRPLFQQVTKLSTGIHGLAVHPNPLPELTKTYESTLSALSAIPEKSVYRQGTEAVIIRKLKIVQEVNGDISEAEKQLDEGQIEEALLIAKDELSLVGKMAEWKA